jgi:hypothetical protein
MDMIVVILNEKFLSDVPAGNGKDPLSLQELGEEIKEALLPFSEETLVYTGKIKDPMFTLTRSTEKGVINLQQLIVKGENTVYKVIKAYLQRKLERNINP